jgi:hypothetical protein
VSKWVKRNFLGITIEPNLDALVEAFQNIEFDNFKIDSFDTSRDLLKKQLNFDVFVPTLKAHLIE